jgi:hypothetical protein
MYILIKSVIFPKIAIIFFTKFEVLSGENIEVMSLRFETTSSVVCRCQLVAIYSRQGG